MSRPTDHANLNLTDFNREVIFGRAGGKVIWQPRILCWYDDRVFRDGKLTGKYDGMQPWELYRSLGCSNRCYDYNGCIEMYYAEPELIHGSSRQISEMETEYIVETPVGTVTTIQRRNNSNFGVYSAKWWAEDEEDIKVLIWLEEQKRYRWNQTAWDNAASHWEGLGLPSIYVNRVNIQTPIVETMGVEGTIYALMDFEDTMEEYFRVLDESSMRMIEAINQSPLEWVNFGDNIHAGITPPNLFEKYILPAYQRRNEKLHEAGKWSFAHWDGDCHALLPYMNECGLDGIEAITPKPQGDVTLEEVRAHIGDTFIVDGIPAIMFDPNYPLEDLKSFTRKILEMFGGQLVLGISDEMSSTGDIERVRVVGELVDEYNASL